MIDSLNKIPGLTQEAVVKHFIDHKTLVSTALSNISTQVEYNQRKLLTDLVAAEVKIIASEVNKFIIHYTGLLEKLDKQAVTSLDKLTAHCKATISDRDNKVMYNFNAVTKKIVIFSLISALLTAPILGFTTGYITSKINKITFFNALNDIVNNKKSK